MSEPGLDVELFHVTPGGEYGERQLKSLAGKFPEPADIRPCRVHALCVVLDFGDPVEGNQYSRWAYEVHVRPAAVLRQMTVMGRVAQSESMADGLLPMWQDDDEGE